MPIVDEHRIGDHAATTPPNTSCAAQGWRAGPATTSQKPADRSECGRHRHALARERGRQDLLDLSTLEPVCDELYPAEQARILRLLIERIDVAPDGISITLHAAGIRSLIADLADQEAPALAASEPLLEAAE